MFCVCLHQETSNSKYRFKLSQFYFAPEFGSFVFRKPDPDTYKDGPENNEWAKEILFFCVDKNTFLKAKTSTVAHTVSPGYSDPPENIF